jgi:hypothetical protein
LDIGCARIYALNAPPPPYADGRRRRTTMAVLVTAEVAGQTREGYEQMIAVLGPMIRQAKGFIAHGAGPVSASSWRSFEVWETAEDATRFFAEHIHPNLPPGVKPARTLVELHALIRP